MMTQAANLIERLTAGIEAPSEEWRARAYRRLDTLTKPPGSLGRLEDLAAQTVAIRQEKFSSRIQKAVYVFAADHGITAEGVSAYPREVTQQMVLNFLANGAAINVLSRAHGVSLHVVDVGVDADFGDIPHLLHRKIAHGTANMLRQPAMTQEQMEAALTIGTELAANAAAQGCTFLAMGEMGIGNTTAASVITCTLTGAAPELATGRGTGVDEQAYARKIQTVKAVLEKHFGPNPSAASPLDILGCVGGFEIAAMTGMALEAARQKLVIVADGFISTAAVALAVAIEAKVGGYIVAGHRSEEPGHQLLLDRLKLAPILTLNMRLGEGTGAVLAMPILESAVYLYEQMATFESAGVSGPAA